MRFRGSKRVTAWVVLGVVAAVVAGVEPARTQAWQQVPESPAGTRTSRIEQLHDAHSVERGDRGWVASELVDEINKEAQRHADWMASTGQFVHSSGGFWEVILTGPKSPDEAMAGWIESKEHRKILMSGAEIGFGYAEADGVTYWVGMVR